MLSSPATCAPDRAPNIAITTNSSSIRKGTSLRMRTPSLGVKQRTVIRRLTQQCSRSLRNSLCHPHCASSPRLPFLSLTKEVELLLSKVLRCPLTLPRPRDTLLFDATQIRACCSDDSFGDLS